MPPLAELSDQKYPNLYSAPLGNKNCAELYSQNSFKGISPKLEKTTYFVPKILTDNHNRCVRMDSTCLLLRNFQTRNIRIVILHILDGTDCQRHHLKNKFKGIFPKIPKTIFSVYFLYKSLTPIVGRRWLRKSLSPIA